MRHHNFQPGQFDGEQSRQFDRPHEHLGLEIELGGMSFGQSARFHHQRMSQIYGESQRFIPPMEIQNGDPRQQNYGNDYYSGSPYGPQRSPYQGQNGEYGSQRPYGEQPQPMENEHRLHHPHHPHHPHHSHHAHHGHHGQHQEGYNPGQPGQGSDQTSPHSSIYTYDGALRSNPEQARESARVVAQVAMRMGVDPVVAVAAMLVESGGNPRAVGDGGHSFGLFQLNYRGELAQAHISPDQAFDPQRNAEIALSYFRKGQYSNPGAMAAAAQRPANRADYARKVNSNMAEAERLVQEMGMA